VEDRHFLNVLGFGFDIAVIEDSWRVKRLQGELVYLYCALRQIYAFPGFPVEIEADGARERRELLMLIVSNARVFGGGFKVAPQARLDDGRLDVTAFGNMGLLRRLTLLARLLRGTHGSAPEVRTFETTALRLRFEAPPAYEVDGEWRQAATSELEIRCVPDALEVLAPPG
jgi:diacylglycerol kinase (ATP)